MKQLPGRTRPRWQQQLVSGLAVGLGLVVMAALLPILLPIILIAGLVAALALIPILRQLRSELEQLDQVQRTSAETDPYGHHALAAKVMEPMEIVAESTLIGRCRRQRFERRRWFEIRTHREQQPMPLHGLRQTL